MRADAGKQEFFLLGRYPYGFQRAKLVGCLDVKKLEFGYCSTFICI